MSSIQTNQQIPQAGINQPELAPQDQYEVKPSEVPENLHTNEVSRKPENKKSSKADSLLQKFENFCGKYHDLFLRYLMPPIVIGVPLSRMKLKTVGQNIFDISLGVIASLVSAGVSFFIEHEQKKNGEEADIPKNLPTYNTNTGQFETLQVK